MTLHASTMKDLELFLTCNTCWRINEFLVILNFAFFSKYKIQYFYFEGLYTLFLELKENWF